MSKSLYSRGLNKPITIVKEYYNKGEMMHHTEYIQGELIQVSNTSITIRQYLTYIDYLNGITQLEYVDREFNFGEFTSKTNIQF